MNIEKEVEEAYKRCSDPCYMYNIVENEVKDFIRRIISRTGRGGVVVGNALDRLFKRIHYMNQCGFEKRYPIQYKYNRLDTLKGILKYINNGGSFLKELEKYLGAFELSVVKEGLEEYKFKTEKTMKKKKVKLDDVRKYIDIKNCAYSDSEVCEKFGISKQQLAGFKAALTKEKNKQCKDTNGCSVADDSVKDNNQSMWEENINREIISTDKNNKNLFKHVINELTLNGEISIELSNKIKNEIDTFNTLSYDEQRSKLIDKFFKDISTILGCDVSEIEECRILYKNGDIAFVT